jgi:hypothetical protein
MNAERDNLASSTPFSSSLALVLAALAFFVGLALVLLRLAPAPSPPTSDIVAGIIRDERGKPLAGAIVRYKGSPHSVVTDADGRFTLSRENGTITAALDGYFIAGATPGGDPITLTLRPLPESDDESYAWVDPGLDPAGKHNCANCHEEMYREWKSSAHARAATGRHFRDLYEGRGGGWGLLTQYPDGSGVCTSCHAPTVPAGDQATFDLREVKGVAGEGVHCDYCHKIAEVPRGRVGLTHGRDGIRLRRPSEGQLFFGPMDDVDRGDDAFAPLYKESRYCASCHEGVVFGVHVYGTYSEWLESPARREGKQCQTCHMKPTGTMTNIAPGKGGIERPTASLASHHFPGGTLAMLRDGLRLAVTITPEAEKRNAVVELTAEQVGHRVPTGFIDRNLVLLVEPFDAKAGALAATSGPVLPPVSGEEVAGKPGRLYAKLLLAKDGKTPEPFWKTEAEPDDTRLVPGKPDRSEYTFAKEVTHLRVRLIYRRFWPQVARDKGWKDNETVVVDTKIAIAAEKVTRWTTGDR